MSAPSGKDTALDQIAALAAAHDVTVDEIAARLGRERMVTPAGKSGIIKQLFGYMGGIFVFSGICLLFGMIWDDIGSAQRVIVTLGSGLIAWILGFLCCRDARYAQAATPFFLVAALLQPAGIFVFLAEYMPYGGDAELAALAVFSVMTLQFGLGFYALRRPALLFLTFSFWTMALLTAMAWLDFSGEAAGIITGISLLCLSYGADRTVHRAITPFWYFWSGVALLCGFWALVEDTPVDLAYLGLNGFLVFVSIRVASRTLLFVSVIGLLSYLGYFTYTYFADVVSWPVALIIMGLAMIGISAYALRLNQRITSSSGK